MYYKMKAETRSQTRAKNHRSYKLKNLFLAGKAEGRGQRAAMLKGFIPNHECPNPRSRPKGAKGLSPPRKHLRKGGSLGCVGLKPTLYCNIAALSIAAFFTSCISNL